MTPEDIGNYTYGCIGRSYGMSLETLLVGSYFAAGLPTEGNEWAGEMKDWNYVKRGYYQLSLEGIR